MSKIYDWKFFCTTENLNKNILKYDYEAPPSVCPTDTTHTIDTTSLRIVNIIDQNLVTIKEESTPTGGYFTSTSIKFDAIGSTITNKNVYFPMPISALSIEFVTNETQTGDQISLMVDPLRTIGVLTANITTLAPSWTLQNYVINDQIFFYDRNYVCIKNTINNEEPCNFTYWKPDPFTIHVSNTVVNNISLGFDVNLYDGINNIDVLRVCSIDKSNNIITIEGAPTVTLSASSPTYVRRNVYMLRKNEIGNSWTNIIGESKIGGSYIPANVVIRIEYVNRSTLTKSIIGRVEYLY